MTDRRVVITGLGVLSPVGLELESFWSNLKEGRSGIGPVTFFDVSDYASRIAGEVDGFEPRDYFNNPKDVRRADRFCQLGMAASKLAFKDAGFVDGGFDPETFGVMVGSGVGGLGTLEKQHSILLERGPSRISPFLIPMMISNIASGQVSMELGLRGPNLSVVTACATANHNIGEAWRSIKFHDADVCLAGGAEAGVTTLGISGFCAMKALSTRNDEPEKASRPFDAGRDGFVIGEGAGVAVIEELEHARKRGARIYAEIVGYGVSGDAHHLTSPHPEGIGASKCMEMALRHGGLNPVDIQYVNAHGTSTGLGDICESRALKATFGDHARNGLAVSSTKSMTGHLLGAAGGVELAASVLAIRDNVVPPTINLDDPDPECDLDFVPHTAREMKVDAALSNSFGFGGHNATLALKRFDG